MSAASLSRSDPFPNPTFPSHVFLHVGPLQLPTFCPLQATHRLCVHNHLALVEQLQFCAVCDVAQPHADPEVGREGVLLSFTLWVLSQRQINPMGVQVPQGQERR